MCLLNEGTVTVLRYNVNDRDNMFSNLDRRMYTLFVVMIEHFIMFNCIIHLN